MENTYIEWFIKLVEGQVKNQEGRVIRKVIENLVIKKQEERNITDEHHRIFNDTIININDINRDYERRIRIETDRDVHIKITSAIEFLKSSLDIYDTIISQIPVNYKFF